MAIPKKKLYERYLARLKPLLSVSPNADIRDIFATAKTSVLRMSRYESSAFDTSWIDKVEECVLDLGEIISNPHIITEETGNLTPIELAKKTKGESVQHLASHTQYIKSIEEDGSVIPSKIISFVNDDFLFTYENRFIATLIRRLLLFIERRYEFVQEYLPLHQEEVMFVKTKAKINDEEVEIETRIKSKAISDDEAANKAAEVAKRITALREYITFYYASPFMRKMKTEHDVRKPIIMTNILRKNLKYHKCYELFVFLERYESLGMNYNADERYFSLNEEQLRDFALIQLGEYLALQDGRSFESIRTKVHNYKPKFLTSIDDEQFVFGELPKGPIQFVRADEEYRQYLLSTIRTDIPFRPNKYEKGYYEDDIEYRREARAEVTAIEHLLRRKAIAANRFEKVVKAIIAKREEEEALLHRMEEQERLEGEELLLARKREEIRNAAFGEKSGEIEANKETWEEEPEEEGVIPASVATFSEASEEPVEEQAAVEEPIGEQPIAEESVSEEPVAEEVSAAEEPEQEEAVEPASEIEPEPEEAIASEPEEIVEPQEEPISEPQPEEISEPQEEPAVEPQQEEPAPEIQEEPAPEPQEEVAPAPEINEKPAPAEEENKPQQSKKARKPRKKNVNSVPNEPEETPVEGRFVVKTSEGYFVSVGVYTKSKARAHVFTDFVKARQEKKRLGGKVVKL